MKFFKKFIIVLVSMILGLTVFFLPVIITAVCVNFFGVSDNSGWGIILIGYIIMITAFVAMVPEGGMVISESTTTITETRKR